MFKPTLKIYNTDLTLDPNELIDRVVYRNRPEYPGIVREVEWDQEKIIRFRHIRCRVEWTTKIINFCINHPSFPSCYNPHTM